MMSRRDPDRGAPVLAEQATERTTIDAPPERCFEVAVRFEDYPQWAHDIKEATVLERDADGRGTRVAYRAAAMGRSARYTLDYDYANAPRQLSWQLVEGDLVRRLDGTYVFEAAGRGTEVIYHLSVELKVPLPGFVKRRVEGRILTTALDQLKKRVEE
jgi:uncharacterized protein YndB with AHSA1/START domain